MAKIDRIPFRREDELSVRQKSVERDIPGSDAKVYVTKMGAKALSLNIGKSKREDT